jgi:hypothetical protein
LKKKLFYLSQYLHLKLFYNIQIIQVKELDNQIRIYILAKMDTGISHCLQPWPYIRVHHIRHLSPL